MWKLVCAGCVVSLFVVAAAVAQADVADLLDAASDPPLPAAEYITGAALPPSSDPPTPQKDPFKPYDIGEGVTPIPESALRPEEQAVIDRGRDVTGWRQVHDAYGDAARELAARARSEAAARQLGIDDLAVQGVVP